jgi:hypothetical protein
MTEKKKIEKKKETCIDCDSLTDDFYKIPTNRGNIVKCAECYELWILRGSRQFGDCGKSVGTREQHYHLGDSASDLNDGVLRRRI